MELHSELSQWPFENHFRQCSVVDPDPEDPDVFGLPGSGSGSVSQWKQLVLVINSLFGLRVN